MRVIATIAIVIGLGVMFAGCSSSVSSKPDAGKQRKEAVETRAATYERAVKAVPVPRTVNFPLRQALAEMTVRQDAINHPWYVYILGQNGNIIGYYVAKTVPINACDFLSSTEDVYNSQDGNLKMTAPSLDGIFYGGSGSSGGCDAWVFFDSATNALIQIRGVSFFSSDQPLKVAADPIKVASK